MHKIGVVRILFEQTLQNRDGFVRLVVGEQREGKWQSCGFFFGTDVDEAVIQLDNLDMVPLGGEVSDQTGKMFKGIFIKAAILAAFNHLGPDIQVVRVKFGHLLQDLDGLAVHIVLFVERNQVAVLGECVTNQTLLLVQLSQPVIDINARRLEFLHLLVNSDCLEIKAGIRVVLGNNLVLRQSLLVTLVATQQLRQLLAIAKILRERFDQFLVLGDRLGDLPF